MNTDATTGSNPTSKGRLAFSGGSMTPFLKPNDQLVVEFFRQPGTGELSPGELALTRAEGEWIVHRVVRDGKGQLRLKGDHNLELDPPAGVAWGRIVGLHRGNRELNWGTQPPLGRMLAGLSLRFHHEIPRPQRWVFRATLFGVSWLSLTALHFRRAMKRADQSWTVLRSPILKLSSVEHVRFPARPALSTAQELALDEKISLDLSLARLRSRGLNRRALVIGFGSTREVQALETCFAEVKELNLTARTFQSGQPATTEQFDLVWISKGILNQMQGRAKRVRFLKDCSRRLTPNGVLSVFPDIQSIFTGSRPWFFSSLLRLRWGGSRWEEGDTVLTGTEDELYYWHYYREAESFLQELRSAGIRNAGSTTPTAAGPWILKRDI